MNEKRRIKRGVAYCLSLLLLTLLFREYHQREYHQREYHQIQIEEGARNRQEVRAEGAAKENREEGGELKTEPAAGEAYREVRMRVLLMDSGYQSYYHPSVTVRLSDGEKTYTPDSPELSQGSLVLQEPKEGGIQVLSIERTLGNPTYRGSLTITAHPEGLVLVNELPLEEYLQAVVPSEMPAGYEPEAQKAQAVCARTYAWRQYLDEQLVSYGAHVDDSVAYQVYNNIQGDEAAVRAVKETAGEILTQGGEPILAYYFSTSAGATSTDEVWEAEDPAPYLQSVACRYDAGEPWSQWELYFPAERLNQRISSHFGNVGELSSLEILKTSAGGAVTSMRILTEGGSRIIENEYEIRALFSPGDLVITKKDGSESTGSRLLPSAYFHLDSVVEDGVLAGYRFLGGGYGHGVGMSQNGANGMAKEGAGYRDILQYFYRDVEIQEITL